MSFLGIEYLFNEEILKEINFSQSSQICADCFQHGLHWLYVSNIFSNIYNINIWYFWNFDLLNSESFDFVFIKLWSSNLVKSINQLFFSVILDIYIYIYLFKYPYYDDWFRSFLLCETNFFSWYNIELIYLKIFFLTYFDSFFTEPRFSIYNSIDHESYNIDLFFL